MAEQQHVGSSADPAEWQIVGVAPVGLVGEVILTTLVIAAAFVLTWFFARWGSRDLEEGKGPLFFYRRR